MMGRAFWFAAGAGAALYGSVKARRLAYRVSLPGLSDQAAALRVGANALLDDIRVGARERETELVDKLVLSDRRPAPPRRLAALPTVNRPIVDRRDLDPAGRGVPD